MRSNADESYEVLESAFRDRLRRYQAERSARDRAPDGQVDVYASGDFDPAAAKQLIRQLENDRGWTSFVSVGTEPRADYLYRLATVQQRLGPYRGEHLDAAQALVDAAVVEVADWLDLVGVALGRPVLVKAFPTGDLNARAVAVDGGALVLVNDGLIDLVALVQKTWLASLQPSYLRDEQVAMVLAETMNAYLYGEGSLKAWRMPMLDRDRDAHLAVMLRRSIQHVILHELAHIGNGDLDAPPATDDDAMRHELDADAFALELLSLAALRMPRGQRRAAAAFAADGALSFLLVARTVSGLADAIGLDRVFDGGHHPLLDDRLALATETLHTLLAPHDVMARPAAFEAWLHRHQPAVTAIFAEVDELLNRPGKWD